MGHSSEKSNLPALIPGQASTSRRADRKVLGARAAAAFAAQVMGQDGARRGLRGGQPVLQAARAAYLETEWSGPDDRRPAPGLLKKTEV